MSTIIHVIIRGAFYFIMLIGAFILFFNHTPYRIIALLIYAVFSAIMIYQPWHLTLAESIKSAEKYLMITALVLSIGIQYFDTSKYVGFYFMIVITYAILNYKVTFSLPYTIAAISAYILMLYYKHPAPTFLDFFHENNNLFLPRSFMIIALVIARYSMMINIENNQLAATLKEKTLHLEAALAELQAQTEEIKQTALIRAREKLMEDIHDKLGHILATASIGVQATSVLMDKDISAAKERLSIAAQQIQAAMQCLREVISGGRTYHDKMELSFIESILTLISETEKHTGIAIIHNQLEGLAEDFDRLSADKRAFLYNALMEGLTNGIKHGKATKFVFNLTKVDDKINFSLSDNGKGFSEITFGYGLSKIQQHVKDYGGHFEIEGPIGCTLKISISVKNKSESEDIENDKT